MMNEELQKIIELIEASRALATTATEVITNLLADPRMSAGGVYAPVGAERSLAEEAGDVEAILNSLDCPRVITRIKAALELADVYMVWHKGDPLGESSGKLLAKAEAYEKAAK